MVKLSLRPRRIRSYIEVLLICIVSGVTIAEFKISRMKLHEFKTWDVSIASVQ